MKLRVNKIGALSALILILSAGAGCNGGNQGVFEATGTVEVMQADIGPKIPGKISKLRFREGDAVRIGDELALLSSDEIQAQLAQANAAKEAAQAQVEAVRSNLINIKKARTRSRDVFKSGGLSEQQFDNVDTQADSVGAQLRAAESMVRQAEATARFVRENLNNSSVTSPMNGVILSKNFEEGEVVMAGAPIFTIADLTDAWLKVYVPEPLLGKIRIGGAVEVFVDSHGNKPFSGKIIFISSRAEFTPKNLQTKDERVKQVFGVKIALDNGEGVFKPGMPADARINLK